jgi:predicted secreted protein
MLPQSIVDNPHLVPPVTVQRREATPLPAVTEIPPRMQVPLLRAEPRATPNAVDGLDINELAKRLFEPLSDMLRDAAEQEAKTAPDPMDSLDIDELARRLFEPLTRMLRAEIRYDRERAGRSHERRY